MNMDPMNQPPGMEAPAPSMDPLDAGAPPAAPSLVLSPEQLQQFGFAGLPDGSTVTAQVTFKTSLAGLEVQDVQNVMPDEADPMLPEGAPPESEIEEADPMTPEETALSESDEKTLGYARPPKKKKPGFPVDMSKLSGR